MEKIIMGEVVKLRKKDFVVQCKCSKKNTFHVFVDEHDPLRVTGYECAVCGEYYRTPQDKYKD